MPPHFPIRAKRVMIKMQPADTYAARRKFLPGGGAILPGSC